MASAEWTIELREGAGYKAPLSFTDDDGQPTDLAGANIRFIVNGGEAEWSTANGRVPVTGSGEAQLTLTALDVAAIDFDYGDYEMIAVWADNTAETIISGKIWKRG